MRAGHQATSQSVKVSLPRQLPSRLTTLQKACTGKGLRGEPGRLPGRLADRPGEGQHPVLPGGLTGTAYFVSHGGAKFPEVIVVLPGGTA